jgi:hypothetical protein
MASEAKAPSNGENAALKSADSSSVLQLPDADRYSVKIWSGFTLMVVALLIVGGARYQSITGLIGQNRALGHTRFGRQPLILRA